MSECCQVGDENVETNRGPGRGSLRVWRKSGRDRLARIRRDKRKLTQGAAEQTLLQVAMRNPNGSPVSPDE